MQPRPRGSPPPASGHQRYVVGRTAQGVIARVRYTRVQPQRCAYCATPALVNDCASLLGRAHYTQVVVPHKGNNSGYSTLFLPTSSLPAAASEILRQRDEGA